MLKDKLEINTTKLIAFLALGFLSGAIGAYCFVYALNYYISSNNLLLTKFTEQYGPDSRVVITDPKKVIVQQDSAVIDSIKAGTGYLAGVYAINETGTYDLKKSVGQAVVLSSDGWLWLVMNDEKNIATWDKYVAITADKKIYSLDKVAKGDVLGGHLVKMVNASSLPVALFASARNLEAGQSLAAVAWEKDPAICLYSASKFATEIRSSELANRKLILDKKLAGTYFIVNLSMQIIGYNQAGEIKTIDSFLPVLNSLSQEKIVKPVLGVNYEALWNLVGETAYKGVRLVKADKLPAVAKNSPAEIAGLKEGDVILAVDNIEINENNDLAEIIAGYKPKTKVYIKYKREKQEKVVEVQLD